jgi:hypothetical protein
MRILGALMVGALALATGGCNPVHRAPAATMMTDADTHLGTRWHGNIVSPSTLGGVARMRGTATMIPAPAAGAMTLTVELSNAAPGGEHPWALHRGACGQEEGMIGELSGLGSVRIGGDGRGAASATVDMHSPVSGAYSVWVGASPANSSRVVGCANLAPPSR